MVCAAAGKEAVSRAGTAVRDLHYAKRRGRVRTRVWAGVVAAGPAAVGACIARADTCGRVSVRARRSDRPRADPDGVASGRRWRWQRAEVSAAGGAVTGRAGRGPGRVPAVAARGARPHLRGQKSFLVAAESR